MRLAVIGAGNVGSTLARATMNAGHDVTVAAPSGDFERVRELQVATTTSNGEAVKDAEVVILAVPFGAVGTW
jgi:predicted dinucleotide-binding enzyme